MSERTFVGFARRGGATRLHVPRRELPVVFVPGIMGSRLSDPMSGGLVWNPLGAPFGESPQPFSVDYNRLGQVSQELVPDETHGYEKPEDEEAWRHVVNHRHVVKDFYAAALERLATLATPAMREAGVTPRVYCSGYDWRQDHARAALRLAGVVERALKETGADQAVIVAHGTGGMVARYYSRVLGGEQRIHQLFLLCSPTLGAPSAYLQLKRGLRGLYAKDLSHGIQGGDIDWIEEGAQGLDAVVRGVSDLAGGHGVGDAALGLLGDVYMVCCLAAGRWLTRKETIYLVRQMPAVYQLLPHGLFCGEYPNWVLFDPMCTGHKPTGFMVQLPSAMDAMLSATEWGLDAIESQLGTRVTEDVESFLRPENAERTSGRATRNMTTLGDLVKKIEVALTPDDPATPAEESVDPGAAIDLATQIKDRFDAVFIDARNPRRLYGDIYTGLLDGVELRAISSANLALSSRFEEMLTVNFSLAPELKPTDLVSAAFDAVMSLLSGVPGSEAVIDPAAGDAPPAPAQLPETPPGPRAYMHPRTWCVSVEDEPTDAGCLLLATNQLSNDDSNVVKTSLIPDVLSQVAVLAPAWRSKGSALNDAALGDGTVPWLSQHPRPEMLSRPFRDEYLARGVKHADIANDPGVLDFIEGGIEASLGEWIRGRAPEGGQMP